MAEIELTPKQRQQLKGAAHRLDPVVLLGASGLTDAVVKEIDRALTAHELIKVRVPGDDRAARDDMFRQVAERLGAARVQTIGKTFVLFRPRPDEAKATGTAPRTGRRLARTMSPAAPVLGKTDRRQHRPTAPKAAPRRPVKPTERTARRAAKGRRGSRSR